MLNATFCIVLYVKYHYVKLNLLFMKKKLERIRFELMTDYSILLPRPTSTIDCWLLAVTISDYQLDMARVHILLVSPLIVKGHMGQIMYVLSIDIP